MKTFTLLLSVITLATALVGCTAETPETLPVDNNPATLSEPALEGGTGIEDVENDPVSPQNPLSLTQDYPDALSLRNQLIVGTFRLEETEWMITQTQAGELLPLWQLLRSLTGTDSANQAETEALLVQIQQTLTPDQIQAIQEMRLTNADNQALLESLGINAQGSGMGGQGSGQGKNMTEAEKAARRATQGVTESQAGNAGSGGARATLDKLIELLENRQAGR